MQPGASVGPYELVALLGRGGMAEVWEAVLHGSHGFRRAVALKVVAAPRDPDQRKALLAEAWIGGLLSHPNVVAIHDAGEVDGQVYIAMELVHGVTSSALLATEPLPIGAVVAIGAQAARGLHHCHTLEVDGERVGLVHRDVKPRNLLVDRYGTVRVADLGVARIPNQGDEDGVVFGTPGFMAPEQYLGTEDARADIFGLGVTMYALATRSKPFVARIATRANVAQALGPALERLAEVPAFAEVIRRCLQPDPADRYATALELGDALARLKVRPVDLSDRVRRSLRESPATPLPPPPRPTLPTPADRFVGREGELTSIVTRVLGDERLFTLLGPAGVGKTRLALEVALAVRPAGGAWRCDLAGAGDVVGVCAAVAGAFGVPLGDGDPVAQIGHVVRARGRVLVVLDSFERAVRHAPETVGAWIRTAPEATWLVTSRIATRLPEERVLAVEPLDAGAAVRLFRDRSGHEDGQDAEIAALVLPLDGLPLAIELAAARSRRMPIADAGARPGPEDDEPTGLRATLQGSFDLLTPWEREALAQLAVFEDGFALEAAVAVLDLRTFPGAPSAAAVVRSLHDQSLLQADPTDGRYCLLRTIGGFAVEGRDPTARLGDEIRHGAYFAQLGSPVALVELDRRGGEERRLRLVADLQNLLVGVRRALERGDGRVAAGTVLAAWAVIRDRGPVQVGLELLQQVRAMYPPGRRRELRVEEAWALIDSGHNEQARAVLEDLVVAERQDELQVRALLGLSVVDTQASRYGVALRVIDQALGVARSLGPNRWEAVALCQLGGVLLRQRRPAEAAEALAQALTLLETVGDQRAEIEVRLVLGLVLRDLERMDEARAELELALKLARGLGVFMAEGRALGNLGIVASEERRLDDAERLYQEALALHRRIGRPRSESITLGNLGALYRTLGRWDEAIRCIEASLAGHRATGDRLFEGHALASLGSVLRDAGQPLEALTRFDQAFALYVATGATSDAVRALRSSAPCCRVLRRTAEEVGRLLRALALTQGSARDEARCRVELLHARLAAGDRDRARAELAVARRAAEESGEPYVVESVRFAGAALAPPGDLFALQDLRLAAAGLERLREPSVLAGCLIEFASRAEPAEAEAALDRAQAVVEGGPYLESAQVLAVRADRETNRGRARKLAEEAAMRARALGREEPP